MIEQRFTAEGAFPVRSSRSVHLEQAEVHSQLDFLGAILGFEFPNGNLPRLVVPFLQEVRDVEIHGGNMDAVLFQVNARCNRSPLWAHSQVVDKGPRRTRRFDVARSQALAEY